MSTPDRTKARLSVQPLEAREVPAVALPRAYLADAGQTVVVSGGQAADAITVTQDDKVGTLTVAGVAGGPAVYRSADVVTLAVDLRGGDDRFEYKTVGPVTAGRQIRVALGDGDDTAIVRWADDGSPATAGTTAVVYGGAGKDAIGFRVGQGNGTNVTLRADGGADDDALAVQSRAPGRRASLDVALRGGDGNDEVGAYAEAGVAATGSAVFDLAGGAGNDGVGFNAAGKARGRFDARVDGGIGDDAVSLTAVELVGPVRPRVELVGGPGDDQMLTAVDGAAVSVRADGGAGADGGAVVPGVTVRNVEQTRPPIGAELRPGPLPAFGPVLPTDTLTRDGRTVEYHTSGTSAAGEPVVVLLTGFGGTVHDWGVLPDRLARRSQVVAVERPGYGDSDPAAGDYGQAVVDDLAAALDRVAPGRPAVLVGWSLGGVYAQLFARQLPGRTAGVVFVDATAPELAVLAAEAGIDNPLGDPTAPAARLQPAGFAQEAAAGVATARAAVGGDPFPAVPVVNLRAEFTVEATAQDPDVDALYNALGDLGRPGETRVVEGAGHNLANDRPDAVVDAVRDVVRLARPQPSRTTLAADVGTGVAGHPVVLTAAVAGRPDVSGTVTFKAGDRVLGQAAVVDGKATLTTTDLPAGRSRVTAEFAGPGSRPSQGSVTVRLAEPSADSKFIGGVLADVARKYGVPGLSAAVVVGDAVTTGAGGVRRADGTDAVQPGDRFANGSTTKAMTATLAAVLVEKGLIRWDSTVGDVFPELKGKIRAEYESATLEEFVRHRTGLIGGSTEDSSPALLEKAAGLADAPPDVARRDILETLLNEPPAVAPGEFYYSNAGYGVAAAMLEKVTGTAYESLMQEYVFGPLGMASATFGPADDAGRRTPVGHDPATGDPVPFDSELYFASNPPVLNPAGVGLRMNAADWATFVRVHLGQEVNGVRLVSADTLARLHAADPRPLQPGLEGFAAGYASGWGTLPAGWEGADPRLGPGITHDGSDNLWLADVHAYPQADVAVLVMANTMVDRDGNDLAEEAFAEVRRRLAERFAPTPPAAQQALDAILADARRASGVPAVAGGVVAGDDTFVGATGVREAGKADPVTAADVFHLGSLGKSITSTLAAVLVDRGVVRWDTTVLDAFPELLFDARPEYLGVTLEELLNHRGGLSDGSVPDEAVALLQRFQAEAGSATAGRDALLGYWLENVPPGARGRFEYSNAGYTLAGAILERKAGKPFEQLVRDEVFTPLGLASAGFGTPAAADPRNPVGHTADGAVHPDPTPEGVDVSSPSGGFFMNAADYAKYLRVHLGDEVNGVRLLSPASLAKLHTPDPRPLADGPDDGSRYGFGWGTVDTPAGSGLTHSGAWAGFVSNVTIVPGRRLATFGFVNQEPGEAAAAALVERLVGPLAGLAAGG